MSKVQVRKDGVWRTIDLPGFIELEPEQAEKVAEKYNENPNSLEYRDVLHTVPDEVKA